jgi:hypothetical protein
MSCSPQGRCFHSFHKAIDEFKGQMNSGSMDDARVTGIEAGVPIPVSRGQEIFLELPALGVSAHKLVGAGSNAL